MSIRNALFIHNAFLIDILVNTIYLYTFTLVFPKGISHMTLMYDKEVQFLRMFFLFIETRYVVLSFT